MKFTRAEIEDILKDADYPSAMISKVASDLESLSPESQRVFEKWESKRILPDDAFDVAGVSPRSVRERNPRMKDIAIILLHDHLVKLVKREIAFLFGTKEREARKKELERKMAEAMFARRNGKPENN